MANANQVCPLDGCPRCGETDADCLVLNNENGVECATCQLHSLAVEAGEAECAALDAAERLAR